MQIGAIYIWSYVYVIIRISANKGNCSRDENGSSIKSSGQTSETQEESATEPLLHSITLEESSTPVESSIVEYEGKVKSLWISLCDGSVSENSACLVLDSSMNIVIVLAKVHSSCLRGIAIYGSSAVLQETFLQRIKKKAKMLTCGIDLKMLLTPITIGAVNATSRVVPYWQFSSFLESCNNAWKRRIIESALNRDHWNVPFWHNCSDNLLNCWLCICIDASNHPFLSRL